MIDHYWQKYLNRSRNASIDSLKFDFSRWLSFLLDFDELGLVVGLLISHTFLRDLIRQIAPIHNWPNRIDAFSFKDRERVSGVF